MRFGEIDRVVSLSKDDFDFKMVAFHHFEQFFHHFTGFPTRMMRCSDCEFRGRHELGIGSALPPSK